MDRRVWQWWVKGIMGVGSLWMGFGCTPVTHQVEPQPTNTAKFNILLINCNDFSTRAVGCYGNELVRTPHLDHLASRGIQFTRAYCNAPMDNPSRASFCTGVRPDTLRIYTNEDPMNWRIPAVMAGLGGVLKEQRAYIANVGDLYYGQEANRHYQAYDQLAYCKIPEMYRGKALAPDPKGDCPGQRFLYSSDPVIEAELIKRSAALKTSDTPDGEQKLASTFLGLYNQVLGDSGRPEDCDEDYKKARIAGDVIRQCARANRQFFLSVAFTKSHVPLVAPKKYVDMYDPNTMCLPEARAQDDLKMPAAAKRFGVKPDVFTGCFDEEFPQLRETPIRKKEAIAAYYAAATFLDAQVGTLLEVLEETDLAKNTIVIFLADHGFHLGEHGLWSKYTQFEEVTRVPLIVYVPGATGNGRPCDEIVELVDILPTLCDLWALRKPGYCEGISFAQLLENPKLTWKKAAFNVFNMKGVASRDITARTVRTKRYRYTEWGEDGCFGIELYDLEADPLEQVNQAYHGKYKRIRLRLAQGLKLGWTVAIPGSPYAD